MNITKKLYIAVNTVLKRLSLLRRWTTAMADTCYLELAKQAFNCIIIYFLACEYEMAGGKLNWTKFPKIALYRAFEKVYISYDVSKEIIDEICDFGKVPKDKRDILLSVIEEKTGDKEFAEELKKSYNGVELEIFNAARSIATYVEMKENQIHFNGDFWGMQDEIIKKMADFKDLPGFNKWSNPESNELKILQKISKLRHQVRWIAYVHQKDCSVLGHLFDTAIFAYFMSIEEYGDEEVATRMFFMGIFHDVPEVWTKDIPSPIKDKIEGFRDATEIYELRKVQENIYDVVGEELTEKIKAVMMEDGDNISAKPLLKGADYLSATRECFLQIVSGTRDWEFYRAAHDLGKKIDNNKAKITPIAKEFYHWILKKIEKLDENSFINEKDED